MSLAQATSACLGETSRRNRGVFSGVFAQARATRLGEITRFQTCSHMQKPRILAQFKYTPNYVVQTSIQHSNMQSRVIRTDFYTNFRRNVSFPYLFLILNLVRHHLNSEGTKPHFNLENFVIITQGEEKHLINPRIEAKFQIQSQTGSNMGGLTYFEEGSWKWSQLGALQGFPFQNLITKEEGSKLWRL